MYHCREKGTLNPFPSYIVLQIEHFPLTLSVEWTILLGSTPLGVLLCGRIPGNDPYTLMGRVYQRRGLNCTLWVVLILSSQHPQQCNSPPFAPKRRKSQLRTCVLILAIMCASVATHERQDNRICTSDQHVPVWRESMALPCVLIGISCTWLCAWLY